MPVKLTTIYRPVVITQLKPRPLPDYDIDTVAQNHLEEAIKADAEKFGESEGYMITVIKAVKESDKK